MNRLARQWLGCPVGNATPKRSAFRFSGSNRVNLKNDPHTMHCFFTNTLFPTGKHFHLRVTVDHS